MSHGFDLASPLVCEGIVGDGCGGGRIFFVEGEKLFAYYDVTQERTLLLCGIENAISISKKSCTITLVCKDEVRHFDLSTV